MPTREELLKLFDQMARLEQRQVVLLYSVLAELEDPEMRGTFRRLLSDELKHIKMLAPMHGQ